MTEQAKSAIGAAVLASILCGVLGLLAGVAIGISHMKWEAARYGHAEWYRQSDTDWYQWRWLPGQRPSKYDLRRPLF